MNKEVKTDLPKVELATKEWTLREIMDTERRIERAFHDQTQFLSERNNELKAEITSQTRWLVGLMVTMTFAIIIAVFFQG